ncbi:MAG: hypothetical protein ACT4P6_09645 [Gemmatimonadaceae bacterium]
MTAFTLDKSRDRHGVSGSLRRVDCIQSYRFRHRRRFVFENLRNGNPLDKVRGTVIEGEPLRTRERDVYEGLLERAIP